MIINGEKVYLYSPFQAKRWTEEEIELEVADLFKKYNPDADTMYLLSENIETIANINYLYGEMVSRLENELAMVKLEADSDESKAVYLYRREWVAENPKEKPPAMSYFEAKAEASVKEKREKQYKLKAMLSRFKYAYDSMEQKMNAIKKKQDAIKYEEWGNMNG